MEPTTITDRLAEESRRLRKSDPGTADAYDRLVQRLVTAGAGKGAPKTGARMPSFALPDESGRLVLLDDLLSSGPVVVSLNRGHWCSYCRIELECLQAISDEVARRGGSIVAITPERQAFARMLKAACNLTFPVLVDMDNAFALSLGLAIWCGAEIRSLYEASDLDLAAFQGNDGWLIPIPATFVVGGDGLVKARFVNPDFALSGWRRNGFWRRFEALPPPRPLMS